MVSRSLKQQLEALRIVSAPLEFKRITDGMTLIQAMQVYGENLRASRSYYPRPTGDMPTLEQATKIYNDQIAMPARNNQRNSN